ncbi:MAG: restriction endonuclease subunit S [Acidimicrobiaceae bacterium]|nr:restriction endonuclease subunit S [Acidimicrobiaceae bacterium]
MTDTLPPGWEWACLGDLGTEVRGRISPEPGTTYDLYSVPAFPTGQPEQADGESIRSGKRPVEEHDVLLCKINPRINRVWAVGPSHGLPQIASTEYLVLRPHEPRMADYLRHYLSSPRFRDWIKLAVEGATGSHTRAKSGPILEQPVPVPPPTEQQRIVAAIEEHFARLDAVERALADAEHRLHALHRSVAVDAFDRPDWDWTTLGEIAEVTGGITKDSKREADPEFEEFPYLRVANVQRGYLDLSDIAMIRADRRKAQRLVLRAGDILFNEGGDRDKLGRGWVWEGQIDGCIHQNHVFRARLLDDRFDPYFVSLHANSWGQQWFETQGKQTTNLASLSLTTLKSFPIPAPSPQAQRAVASHLRTALDSVQHQRLELERLAARTRCLRRSILAEALSGRLVPAIPRG